MSAESYKVSLTPKEALELVKKNESADLVHEELHNLGSNVYIGTLIFDKYFLRVDSNVALVVIIDNIYGPTGVRTISTGSAQGFLKFDWGASEKFTTSVRKILDKYIMDN